MDRFTLGIFSLTLSIALYLLIVLGVLHFFTQENPTKIAIKAQSIDIMISEPKKEMKKVVTKKRVEKKSTPKKHKKSGSKSPKKRANIKNLFASLDTKSLHAETPKRKSTEVSRFKGKGGKKAQKLLEKLQLKEFQPAQEKSIKSVEGKQDPYLEKVYKILYTYWIPSKESAGAQAKVKIIIDTQGNFDYKVLQYSNNETFNEELDEYLQAMKSEHFPKPDQKRELTVLFVAKD
ncbi:MULTISPECIES: energy transducer TonB [unclassified Nitratiruptor]|uniref:energy transducer TonB n=1 Tax=unclassified Nitratiruptor TaxID=2624044 RepID=UPI0019151A49|nr:MULTISPECIES: energy transducer TonB [unclassified Nitratiruptor]BCD60061.1 hypothetical protein NitYY0810_C0826 [Nitratiruptor sp. YY08-10]BCD64450.1 hypothetical protein NitYY0814_C1295 [Nitratiruptor sp. YY08-14]